jgi:hypothetical protein
MVLLTGAGLMVKSFARMYAHPPSFEPEKIGIAKVFLSGPAYRDSQRDAAIGYAQRAIEKVSAVPGVEKAALRMFPAAALPMSTDLRASLPDKCRKSFRGPSHPNIRGWLASRSSRAG